jgi:N-acetylmuramoyl-L-alanine amidase
MMTHRIAMQGRGCKPISTLKPECRMSNREFRMMKLNSLCCFLRSSLFVIRYSAVHFRRAMHRAQKFQLKTLILLLLTLLFLPGHETLAQPPSEAKTILGKADRCADTLMRSKEKKKFRHKWSECIDAYRNVASRYPQSEEAGWALYKAAKLQENLSQYSGKPQDLDEAIELYRRVINDYPNHRAADDAQYRIGEIYYQEKNDITQAYLEFLKVEKKFPKGDMRPKAQQMVDKLSGMITRKENQKEIKEANANAQGLAQVQEIRHWSTPNYTRVVIDLERPVQFEHHLLPEDKELKKPRRIYLDLKDALVPKEIDSVIPIRDGLLQGARAAQYTKDTVRVVLDIDNIEGYKVFPLQDPFRIVIDVRGAEVREKTEEKTKEKEPEKEKEPDKDKERKEVAKVEPRRPRRGVAKAKEADRTVTLARQLGLGVKRIVLDPGHGGKDPGCYIHGQIVEKDITLALARIVEKKVQEKFDIAVLLTRDKDVFVPLEKRTAFANVNKADLFISLHINANKQSEVHGFETYFLNMATDERAVLLAARENATSEKSISDLQSILNDLMLNTKISESSKLAHDVQRGVLGQVRRRYEGVRDLGVKQAPFYVLIGAEMPAILVETGFMTNSVERKRLRNPRYLQTLADGIVAGIERYMKSLSKSPRG